MSNKFRDFLSYFYSSHHNNFYFSLQWTIKTFISPFADGIDYTETNFYCLLTVAIELVATGNSMKPQHIVINPTDFNTGKNVTKRRTTFHVEVSGVGI